MVRQSFLVSILLFNRDFSFLIGFASDKFVWVKLLKIGQFGSFLVVITYTNFTLQITTVDYTLQHFVILCNNLNMLLQFITNKISTFCDSI